ncbi:4-hydroxy-3-methylbut-2-enyl diphosphate reductase, partial [Streptomyces sp. NPDC056734]
MSRSPVSWYAAAPAVALPAGHVLVANELSWPDGRVTACSAAPMVAGSLSAADHRVVTSAVRLLEEGPGSGLRAAVTWTGASADRAGEAVDVEGSGDVAVVVAASGTALRPVVGEAVESWARVMGPRTVLLAS